MKSVMNFKVFAFLGCFIIPSLSYKRQVLECPLSEDELSFNRNFEVHYFGKPTPFITTRSVGKDPNTELVDPFRESALFHEYILVGPGFAGDPDQEDEDERNDEEEEIKLIIYDEDGIHGWKGKPILGQHNLAKEHAWALINATGMLPSMTVSNTTFRKTLGFHADAGDNVAYHLSYPHLFRSQEPCPPFDVLVEFPANTRTLRSLKTMIDYQTFSLLRWKMSPAPLVTDTRNTTLGTRATTVTFHEECETYFKEQAEKLGLMSKTSDVYFDPRFMTCIYQRRLNLVENPCIRDMFVVYLILDYEYHGTETRSTSQLMIAIPMFYNLTSPDSRGWANLTDVYCPEVESEECEEPLDVVLTNDHLLILTDRSIWVSASLNGTTANSSLPYDLKPLLRFTPVDPCAYLDNFNCSEVGTPMLGHQRIRRYRLFYNPICHLYQYPFYEDVVIYVVDHVTQSPTLSEEWDAYTVLYAMKPYLEWKVLFQSKHQYVSPYGPLPIKQLIDIFFNHHKRHFDITVLLHDDGRDRTFRFVLTEPSVTMNYADKELNGLLGNGFLEHEFPSSFYMTHLQVNPETMDVYFLGNQIWIAEAAGAFLYVSVPFVFDHNGNESLIGYCSFNHPDRSYVCAEKTHAELYVGRVGVSYSPVAVEFKKITEFKYTALYQYWPVSYIYHIGLTGHFIVSYSGKIILWFSPNHLLLYKTLAHIKETVIDSDKPCEVSPADEFSVGCSLCDKLKDLFSPKHNCKLIELQGGELDKDKFPFSFDMVAFDPAKFPTRDTTTHGPLVPFLIDGDKAVIFEAEVPPLSSYKPERNYLNSINVGNKIICRPPADVRDASKSCDNRKEMKSNTNCQLYIRTLKSLKREGEFAFLDGFRRALYVSVLKSFPLWPIPTEVVVIIRRNSNHAEIQLNHDMFEEDSSGNHQYEYTFDYSSVGMTLYIPQHFSVLLTGFSTYVRKSSEQCEEGFEFITHHNLTRMSGFATRYYRLGTRVHVKPFQAYLIKFPTNSYCDWYLRSVNDVKFQNCTLVSGDLIALQFQRRMEKMEERLRNDFDDHSNVLHAVNSVAQADLHEVDGLAKPYFGIPSSDEWIKNRMSIEEMLKVQDLSVTLATTHRKVRMDNSGTPNDFFEISRFKCAENNWSILDGGCHLQLVLENNLVIKQSGGRISLDKHDSISFTMKLRALTPLGKSLIHRPLMVISNSNPEVLLVERKETIGRDPQIISVTLQPTGMRKGTASVTIRPIIVSSHCQFSDGSFTLIVQVHRVEGRRLHINYPIPTCKPRQSGKDPGYPRPWKIDLPSCVSRKELLRKEEIRRPKDEYGEVFYSALPVNYRPPSFMGTHVPIHHNVYNVDPAQPKFRNFYRISQESDVLQKCHQKSTKEDCKCTENDMLSDDEKFSDCKKMVYTVRRGFRVDISVDYDRIMRDEDQHLEFFSPKTNWTVFVEEVNERKEFTIGSISNKYLETVHNNLKLRQDDRRIYHDTRTLSVTPHGTGLFHFKATLGHFDTFDEVTGYFMVYVPNDDLNHVQLVIVMLLTITICMTLVFVGFLIVRKRLIAQLPFQVREKNKLKLD